MRKKYKYVIVSPRTTKGGPIVLHALCRYLTDLGEDAKMFYINDPIYRDHKHLRYWIKWMIYTLIDSMKLVISKFIDPNHSEKVKKYNEYINFPIKNCKRKVIPIIDKKTIVIYPEVIYGNILHAKNVVRWFLYYGDRYKQSNLNLPGKQYGKNDLFFCFREVFNLFDLNPNCNKLYIQYYDLNTYRRYNFGPRKGRCYIIRKGATRSDLPKNIDGIVIDDLPEKEKVKILNESEYCISYDTQTSYSQIAALCGCISIVVPEEGKSKTDYRTENDIDYGEAFSFDEYEIQEAIKSSSKVLEHYQKCNNEGKESVVKFIEICQKHFSKLEE